MDYLIGFYIASVIGCFNGYIWYARQESDIYISDILRMIFISLFPVLNILALIEYADLLLKIKYYIVIKQVEHKE